MHLAFIVDGNRRWAKNKGFPIREGHAQGIERVQEIVEAGPMLGIKVMTFYCFSTENWKRSKLEINYLMRLFNGFLKDNLAKMMAKNVRIRHIGRQDRIPKFLKKTLDEAIGKSRDNTGLVVNLALDYGGRDEIVRAVKRAQEAGETEITEEILGKYLDIAPYNEVDLLIRTSGEIRLSNFLIWENAYAEFKFLDYCFPDFKVEQLKGVLKEYEDRVRRFGG